MNPDESSFEITQNIHQLKYKVVFLGDSGVGKSALVERIVTNSFDDRKQQTIGIDFLKKYVTHNEVKYQLMLWDTAGQEKFNSLIPGYLRGANCAILVYDVTNQKSFEDCEKWLEIVNNAIGNDSAQCSVILVANKTDLKQRQIKFQTGFEWALKKKISFVEASAKTGTGIENVIKQVIESTQRKIQSSSTVESDKKMDGSSKTTQQSPKLQGKPSMVCLKQNNKNCCSI